MKTFLIKEIRENEKGEQFVVESKIQARSLAELIASLKKYDINPLWDNNYRVTEVRDGFV